MLSLIVIPLHAKKTIEKSMSQEKINWQELDQEYFELWAWILKECDGDWTKTYQGRSHQKAEEYRTKQKRFGEICRRIDERKQPYYFCWLKTHNARWSRGHVPAAHPEYVSRLPTLLYQGNGSLHEIENTLSEILSTHDRFYWLISLLSALPKSISNIKARKELEDARTAYKSRHLQYSNVLDHLLSLSGDFLDSVEVLRHYLYDRLYVYKDEPVEVACGVAVIKADSISSEQANTINDAAIVEFSKFLNPDPLGEPMDTKHATFFFCETDFVYPHRRVVMASHFKKFLYVATIDFFYKCNIDNDLGIFSQWASETTQVIDRWSPEHVDAFKEFFISCAETEDAKWKQRFDSGIDSETPDVTEKYLKTVYTMGVASTKTSKKKPVSRKHDNGQGEEKEDQKKYVVPVKTLIEQRADAVAAGEAKRLYKAEELVPLLKKTDKFKGGVMPTDKSIVKGIHRTQAWKDRKKTLANAQSETGLGKTHDNREKGDRRNGKKMIYVDVNNEGATRTT